MSKSVLRIPRSLWRPWNAVRRPVHRVLGALRGAAAQRRQLKLVGKYIAVTGSCGKSTTTLLIGKILSGVGSTRVANHPNYGPHLIRTVRKLRAPVDFVVQEASGWGPGALVEFTHWLRIDVAVVTAVGLDHGSRFRYQDVEIIDAIAREKGRIVEAADAAGFVCLNADDPRVRAMAARARARVVTFGLAADADLRASNLDARWPGRLSFDLLVDGQTHRVATRFVGTLMLPNILAALAVAHGLGLDLKAAISAIAAVEPVRDRMGVHQGADGKTYILDAFKASYWSTVRMVDDLPSYGTREMIFVLGDMSDIGNDSGRKYRKLLRTLCQSVNEVVAAGNSARYVEKLQAQGITNLVEAPTAIDVARYLDTRPPGLVILKSSKNAQLWRVLEQVTPRQPVETLGE